MLWTLSLNWDQTPPKDVVDRWLKFKSELASLSQIKIPRHLPLSNYSSIELHGFCDASERGFAAAAYFRIVSNTESTPKTFLVMAKSKVAPLKKLSLPRLELCGALLLANLVKYLKEQYETKIPLDRVVAWCDSTVALLWIKSPSYKWKTFVANRVSHIQDIVPPSCWFHIRSHDNPADCASRGLTPLQLTQHALWWALPLFLRDTNLQGPLESTIDFTPPIESLQEERKVVLATQIQLNWFSALLTKVSVFLKLQSVVSFSLRFIYNCKKPNQKLSGAFSELELHNALLTMVKQIQSQVFAEELQNIQINKLCSKPIRKLSPFLDEMGLLRVGGRLCYANLSDDQKHPLLLPGTHRFTSLLIEHLHKTHLHPGIQNLHFLLAQQFWILSARRAIKQCISKCIRCFRSNPSVITPPIMGNLPAPRVSQLKPFSHTGVDFAGPFSICMGRYRGAKTSKAYICIIVCLAVKALHLELVSDLSSEAFLAAFRRFVARRGRCSDIYSDCGKNFVGANNLLINYSQQSATSLAIKWHFNPPSAPHFGGIWEAGVKTVKTHLSRVVGDQRLTYEEFYTLLTQIEAVVNSRPLSPLSPDPNDFSALISGHFLTLEPLTAPPTPNLDGVELLQSCHQHFWRRWHNEYLHTLQQRAKWHKTTEPIKIDTLVLIKQENIPPLQWSLGRIVAVHPGADGVCRVVTVKTSHGSFRRPVTKLCPLPSQ